jgi:hypothetical protein
MKLRTKKVLSWKQGVLILAVYIVAVYVIDFRNGNIRSWAIPYAYGGELIQIQEVSRESDSKIDLWHDNVLSISCFDVPNSNYEIFECDGLDDKGELMYVEKDDMDEREIVKRVELGYKSIGIPCATESYCLCYYDSNGQHQLFLGEYIHDGIFVFKLSAPLDYHILLFKKRNVVAVNEVDGNLKVVTTKLRMYPHPIVSTLFWIAGDAPFILQVHYIDRKKYEEFIYNSDFELISQQRISKEEAEAFKDGCHGFRFPEQSKDTTIWKTPKIKEF